MNKMIIKKISAVAKAADIVRAFSEAGIEKQHMDVANWADSYPYKPEVEFSVAHDGESILVLYHVREESVRAVAGQDGGHVWEDSCCEFFFAPDDRGYYNIECNCAGTLLVAYGAGRESREQASPETMRLIDREASLGRKPFDTTTGENDWTLALRIPLAVFFHHPDLQLVGLSAKGNFYKCGDLLPKPHFLSWNKVGVEKPDFHRPNFFGELRFGK